MFTISQLVHTRVKNCREISSIFRVSGHPDKIFANENRFLEKSEKITQNRRYISNLPIYSTQKYKLMKKLKKTSKLADISAIYADISASLNVFEKFFFKKKTIFKVSVSL